MALVLPYPDLDFVPLDVLTAEEMNEIVANYTYIADNVPDAPKVLKPGDTLRFGYGFTSFFGGHITSGSTIVQFSIPLGFPIDSSVQSITMVGTTTATVRGIGGYVIQDTTVNDASYSFSITFEAGLESSPLVYARIRKESGTLSGTNNTPVSISLNPFTLRFS